MSGRREAGLGHPVDQGGEAARQGGAFSGTQDPERGEGRRGDRKLAAIEAPQPLELVDLEEAGNRYQDDRREHRLRDALLPLRAGLPHFDFVLIDCPPSLGLLTINALVAADAVLVPLQCEYYALEGISGLVRTIDGIKRSLNPTLRLQGIVLTMFDRRNALSGLIEQDARGYFGDTVYATVIPRNVRVSEAPSHGKPVLLYDFRSPGAQAYIRLAAELLRRDRADDQPLGANLGTDA